MCVCMYASSLQLSSSKEDAAGEVKHSGELPGLGRRFVNDDDNGGVVV